MEWFQAVTIGGVGLAVVLLVARFFCTSRTVKAAFLLVPGLIFSGIVLLFVASFHPGPFSFLLPYETLGRYKTTDVDGTTCEVVVQYKYLSNSIPPGMLPRIRLVANSPKGRTVLTHDTGWRFEVGSARPLPGGIEIFSGFKGTRFRLEKGEWRRDRGVLHSTSLWEDRLDGLFKVGMTRDAILELVRAHRSEALPDLRVRHEGDYLTQHSLDREAALYVKYSADGLAEKVLLKPRFTGTIEELRGEIDEDLFPLVALIHGAPKLLDADPVGLLRAVNGLRAAGPQRSVAALREYQRLTDLNAPKKTPFNDRKFDVDADRLFCIIRLLFVLNEGAGPMPVIDMPWVRKPPPGQSHWPLYPVTVESGFPFVVWTRQLGGGSFQNPIGHLEFCLRNGRLRDSDLEPEGSPLDSMASLLASESWTRLFPAADRSEPEHFLRRQLISALRAVLPFDETTYPDGENWRTWVKEASKLEPRWDKAQQVFLPGRK